MGLFVGTWAARAPPSLLLGAGRGRAGGEEQRPWSEGHLPAGPTGAQGHGGTGQSRPEKGRGLCHWPGTASRARLLCLQTFLFSLVLSCPRPRCSELGAHGQVPAPWVCRAVSSPVRAGHTRCLFSRHAPGSPCPACQRVRPPPTRARAHCVSPAQLQVQGAGVLPCVEMLPQLSACEHFKERLVASSGMFGAEIIEVLAPTSGDSAEGPMGGSVPRDSRWQ